MVCYSINTVKFDKFNASSYVKRAVRLRNFQMNGSWKQSFIHRSGIATTTCELGRELDVIHTTRTRIMRPNTRVDDGPMPRVFATTSMAAAESKR
jgi:hypothetical protein